MSRPALMRTTAALAFLFGVPLLLSPHSLLALYRGIELNVSGVYQAMLHGACLVAIGVMNWLAAPAPQAAARPVIVGTLVLTVLGSAVAITRQLAGLAPAAAWLNVALYVVLAVLYAWMLRPGAATSVTGSRAA